LRPMIWKMLFDEPPRPDDKQFPKKSRVGRLTAGALDGTRCHFPEMCSRLAFPKLPGADGETGQPMAV
jgi:hypothetical protein